MSKKTIAFNMDRKLMQDIDFAMIGEQIAEGYSSGNLDNGEGKKIY